jgi:hypothetical protein
MFPFALRGIFGEAEQAVGHPYATIKYKSPGGDVKQTSFQLAHGDDEIVTSGADNLMPLVGGVFRIEDVFSNYHTYHLPNAGVAPFHEGCSAPERASIAERGKAALDDIDAQECTTMKENLSGALREDKMSKEEFAKFLDRTKGSVKESCDLSEFNNATPVKAKKATK